MSIFLVDITYVLLSIGYVYCTILLVLLYTYLPVIWFVINFAYRIDFDLILLGFCAHARGEGPTCDGAQLFCALEQIFGTVLKFGYDVLMYKGTVETYIAFLNQCVCEFAENTCFLMSSLA